MASDDLRWTTFDDLRPQVDDELLASVASSLVLGKLVAFTLLVLGAYLMTFGVGEHLMLVSVATLSDAMHFLSLLGGSFMLAMAWRNPSHRAPHMWTVLGLIGLQTAYSAVFLAILQQLGGLGRRAAEVGAGSGTAPAIASPKLEIVRLPVVAVLVVEADAEGPLPNELVGRPGPLLGQYARK